MITSIGTLIILGLLLGTIFTKFRLPGLLGTLILGIILGPYLLGFLDDKLLGISGEARKIALIIILLRAGFGIKINDLKKVGFTAIKLSCLPGIFEGFTIAFVSVFLLGFTFIEGGILGFILAAVSPAVIVPQMLDFMDKKIGTKKSIPTLILAGASIDDVFAITIFTAFLGLYNGNRTSIGMQLLNIPVSIVFGISIGLLGGLFIFWVFKKFPIEDTKKFLIVLSLAMLLTSLEDSLKSKIEIASLLGVMAIGFIISYKSSEISNNLSSKFNKAWILAEIFLFVLVGAQVDINVALKAGFTGLVIIFTGLLARSLGVILSTLGTNLNFKERLFCVISYTPKATVQAAIGAIPMSMGIPSGKIILAIAVSSILVTAPLGAIAIKLSGKRLLSNDEI